VPEHESTRGRCIDFHRSHAPAPEPDSDVALMDGPARNERRIGEREPRTLSTRPRVKRRIPGGESPVDGWLRFSRDSLGQGGDGYLLATRTLRDDTPV